MTNSGDKPATRPNERALFGTFILIELALCVLLMWDAAVVVWNFSGLNATPTATLVPTPLSGASSGNQILPTPSPSSAATSASSPSIAPTPSLAPTLAPFVPPASNEPTKPPYVFPTPIITEPARR